MPPDAEELGKSRRTLQLLEHALDRARAAAARHAHVELVPVLSRRVRHCAGRWGLLQRSVAKVASCGGTRGHGSWRVYGGWF